jgi:DNA polymerase-3 subunit beta
MKFRIARETLLKPLQHLAGVVERRQTLPVLANVLMVLDGDRLSITGTDTEVELVANLMLEAPALASGETTIPAKKLLDIVKSLPEGVAIDIEQEENRVILKAGRSRFSLATLPSSEFPNLEDRKSSVQFTIRQAYLKELVDKTGFAMAQQDVRFYLNGMLLEVTRGRLRAVATDGHRLALGNREIVYDGEGTTQAIVPRKGIVELARLFGDADKDVMMSLSANHIRAETADFRFTSKLIDARYPDYERVLPKHGDKTVLADKDSLKQCFSRVAILSNEKYRGVRVRLEGGSMTAAANNPEQEEAEELVSVDYNGPALEIGFNVSYLIDVLNVMKAETVNINLTDGNSSALMKESVDDSMLYVVMPMRL